MNRLDKFEFVLALFVTAVVPLLFGLAMLSQVMR